MDDKLNKENPIWVDAPYEVFIAEVFKNEDGELMVETCIETEPPK